MAISADSARDLLTKFHRVANDASFDLTPARRAAAQRRLPNVVNELRNFATRCRDCSWSTALIDQLERAEAIVLAVGDAFPLQYLQKREVLPEVLRQQIAELKDGIPTLEGVSTELESPAPESDGWRVPMLIGLEAKLHFLADWMDELRVPDRRALTEDRLLTGQRQEFFMFAGSSLKEAAMLGAFAAEFSENKKLQSLLTMERNEQARRKLSPEERDIQEDQLESRRREEWDAQQGHDPDESNQETNRRSEWDRWRRDWSQKSPEQRRQSEEQRRKVWDTSRGGSDWTHAFLDWVGYSDGWTYPKMFRRLAEAVHDERLRLMSPTACGETIVTNDVYWKESKGTAGKPKDGEEPPRQTYLDLVVNVDRCEVSRKGEKYAHLQPVKLAGDVEWQMFCALYRKAGENLTDVELGKLSGEASSAKRMAKSRLNEKLSTMDVKIPHAEWRLTNVD